MELVLQVLDLQSTSLVLPSVFLNQRVEFLVFLFFFRATSTALRLFGSYRRVFARVNLVDFQLLLIVWGGSLGHVSLLFVPRVVLL